MYLCVRILPLCTIVILILELFWHFSNFQIKIFLSKVNPDNINVYVDTNDDASDNNDQTMILSKPPREPDTMPNKDEYTTV